VVKASVYTLTNCSAPYGAGGCVSGTANESGVTLPYARLNFTGGTCTGDACFSNGAGGLQLSSRFLCVATSLDGKYFKIVDTCGAVAAARRRRATSISAPRSTTLPTPIPIASLPPRPPRRMPPR